MRELIFGRNPVYETLKSNRRDIFGLMVAEGVKPGPEIQRIFDLCEAQHVPIQWVPRDQVDRINDSTQGVALEVNDYPYSTLEHILARGEQAGQKPFVLILDSLQDPQNLGTLLRTAEAVGVHGVCIPPRHSAKVTPAVVSASSGATEHMDIVQINLANAIRILKEAGLWVIGLDHGEASSPPSQIDLSGPVAIVVGNEGQGMRRLVRESCDLLLRLPMVGQIESLNAAIAGSIALYLVFQTRSG